MTTRILFICLAAMLAAPGCKAPIPGREEIEADAAWTAGDWTDDAGTVWRARINGRHINATAEEGPGKGRIMRGTVQNGVLHYTVEANDGTDLFPAGEARIADATHAVFHDDPMTGDAGPHGVWHFKHKPTLTGAPAPSVAASPTPVVIAPATAPTAAPSSAPAVTPTPEAQPVVTPTPSSAPAASPGAPGAIDLLPPR